MSSTYDLLRQALNILQDAEQDGLPAPTGVKVDNYHSPLTLHLPTQAEAFTAWVRYLDATLEPNDPESEHTNLNAWSIRDGVKISLFTGGEIAAEVVYLLGLDEVAAR